MDRKQPNAPDPGRLRRRRRFQTRNQWLILLAFSTYLTRIASPGPMLAIIQIVNLRFIHASQPREPTWDLIIDTRRKCRNWLRLHPPEKQKRHGSAYNQEACFGKDECKHGNPSPGAFECVCECVFVCVCVCACSA